MLCNQLSIILVAMIAVQGCSALFPQIGYRKVNNFLEILDGTPNAKEYMLELRKKLTSILQGGFIARNKNPLFVAALKNIVKLEPLLEFSRCSPDEVKSIAKLPVGATVQKYIPESEFNNLTRLEWLVHQVFLARASNCRQVYPRLFNKAYSELNSTVKNYAEFKREVYDAMLVPSERDYMEYLIDAKAHTEGIDEVINLAIEHLTSLSSKEDDLCNFKALFNKYLKNPCVVYNNKLAGPIFNQVIKEASMFEGQTGYLLDNSNLVKFYESMSHVRDCDSVDQDFEFLTCLHWNDNHRPDNCPESDCA